MFEAVKEWLGLSSSMSDTEKAAALEERVLRAEEQVAARRKRMEMETRLRKAETSLGVKRMSSLNMWILALGVLLVLLVILGKAC